MTNSPSTSSLETISPAELDAITGAGIGTQIGSMFGDKGAKWGGIADSLLGMVGGASGGAGIGGILGKLGGLGGAGGAAAGAGAGGGGGGGGGQ